MITKHVLGAAEATEFLDPSWEPLSVGIQSGEIVVWGSPTFYTDDIYARRFDFHAVNTGSKKPDGKFVGTVTTDNGSVWHVFCEPSDALSRWEDVKPS